MKIRALKYNDKLWNELIDYAMNCSWRAGSFLAKKMRENSFEDWEKVVVILIDKKIAAYCTITKKECIPDVEYTPYVGFVFVDEDHRGKRLSEKMIGFSSNYVKKLGFSKVFLVTEEKGLYEKYGFDKIAERKDICGNLEQIFCLEI